MPTKEEIRARRRKKKQQQRLTIIMVVAGVALIALAIIMLPAIQRSMTPVGDFTVPEPNPRPMADGNAMGDPNAPVTIIEFSDFGCGHCAAFAQDAGERITEDYIANGKVYFVSRSVGGLLRNPLTQRAAEAAYCAADQNKYWEYHDIIYANQSILFYGGLSDIDNYLKAFAETLQLDPDQFDECLKSGQHKAQLQEDEHDANAAGINGTPSFLINGEVFHGNMPYNGFQEAIESHLP
jgi:protein-disulfide isomerase